jgi:2-methyl-3-hydroxypyridine 5-carboxylic acid dioxygenase
VARRAEIAGAGFAGLTTAIALRQRGWSVRVHEAAPEVRAFGAGIVLWENGLRVLAALGLEDAVVRGAHVPPAYETRLNGAVVSRERPGGSRMLTMPRQHLHRALLDGAGAADVEIETSAPVVGADPRGELVLADGRRLSADVVVGADGVASRVRDSLGLTRARERHQDGIVRLLVRRPDLGPGDWDSIIDFWRLEPRVMRILYVPCGPDQLYLAFMAPTDDLEASALPIRTGIWTRAHPELGPAIELAAAVQGARYDGYQTSSVTSWSAGRVALVGDSAHAMCPALAQGAGCALVNGLALAVSLDERDGVENALALWEARERPLTDRTQLRSAEFARTRTMAQGNQWTPTVLETATHVPTGFVPQARRAC